MRFRLIGARAIGRLLAAWPPAVCWIPPWWARNWGAAVFGSANIVVARRRPQRFVCLFREAPAHHAAHHAPLPPLPCGITTGPPGCVLLPRRAGPLAQRHAIFPRRRHCACLAYLRPPPSHHHVPGRCCRASLCDGHFSGTPGDRIANANRPRGRSHSSA